MSVKNFLIKYQSLIRNCLRLGFGVGIALLLCQIPLQYIEFYTYDLRFRLKPTSPVSGLVKTVAIQKPTVEALERFPNALDIIEVIKRIGAEKPKAIVLALAMEQMVGSYEELEEFANTAKPYPLYVVGKFLHMKGMEDQAKLSPPLDELRVVPAIKTRDINAFAKDGVTRRIILSYQDRPTLHSLLAGQVNGIEKVEDYKGAFQFLSSKQSFIDFHPSGTYSPLQFIDVMTGNMKPGKFKDKIVILGRETMTAAENYIKTPYSRESVGMSTLEMHANIFDTLIQDRSIKLAPDWLNLLLTALISVLTVFVVLTVRPAKGLLILLISASVFVLISYLAFAFFQFSIAMAHPLLAIFICYYFFIPYRLIMENRRSWEYYQRNKLLTKVEELKTNFMRMMSHDLKTPLARIQGMTDVVMQENENLSAQQKEALTRINRSAEELTEFIGSVLSLGRIESKEIKLQLRSKDVNSLLQEVIRKSDYLARKKKIDIITELEPMFSLQIDEDLLRQVFTNLVENAIKYSPDDSKILVTSEEVNGKILVQVADQGMGIPEDELDHVFDKFYRSRDVTAKGVKGSGLGLYLSSYFVNLHNGRISVESQIKKGSTFTVELPTNIETQDAKGGPS